LNFSFFPLLMFANCARDFIFIYSFALAYASLHECCCCCLLVLSFIVSLSRISPCIKPHLVNFFFAVCCVVCACSFIYFYSLSFFIIFHYMNFKCVLILIAKESHRKKVKLLRFYFISFLLFSNINCNFTLVIHPHSQIVVEFPLLIKQHDWIHANRDI
jgi:hypothetical protein